MTKHSNKKIAQQRLLILFVSCALAACQEDSAEENHHLPEVIPRLAETATIKVPPKPSIRDQPSHYNATTAAHRISTLSPSVPGVIESVHVNEGDHVSKGDILVTLDQANAELRYRQAAAGLRLVLAQASAAKTETKRATQLHVDKAIPTAQLDRTTAQLRFAQAGVAQAKAAVALAKRSWDDVVVRAPYDGVIARRMASEGEFAASMPPKMLVVLQEQSPIDLRISIPAADVHLVHEGTLIKVNFGDGYTPIEGAISRISPSLDPQTRSLTAIAELPNTRGSLRPGMFAEVEILKTPIEDATRRGQPTP